MSGRRVWYSATRAGDTARLRAYSTTSWSLVAQSSTPMDGRLVRLPHVAVEGFQVEFQLAEMLGLELVDLQFDGDQGS